MVVVVVVVVVEVVVVVAAQPLLLTVGAGVGENHWATETWNIGVGEVTNSIAWVPKFEHFLTYPQTT